MSAQHQSPRHRATRRSRRSQRRGIYLVLTCVLLVAILGFVALATDTGMVALTKARMQTAVDAAALAATQEVVVAIETAGINGGSASDINSIAAANAPARSSSLYCLP